MLGGAGAAPYQADLLRRPASAHWTGNAKPLVGRDSTCMLRLWNGLLRSCWRYASHLHEMVRDLARSRSSLVACYQPSAIHWRVPVAARLLRCVALPSQRLDDVHGYPRIMRLTFIGRRRRACDISLRMKFWLPTERWRQCSVLWIEQGKYKAQAPFGTIFGRFHVIANATLIAHQLATDTTDFAVAEVDRYRPLRPLPVVGRL